MVIAVPTALVVQWDNEQVGAFEMFQSFLSSNRRIEQYGITQRAAHTVENGRAQQESLHTFGLPSQDFFNQIVQHKTVTARERLDEATGVWLSLQGQRG